MITAFCINCKYSNKISGSFDEIYCIRRKGIFPKMYVDDVCTKYVERSEF
jgi:hypothetical protein